MDNDKMIVPISKSKNEYDSLDIVLWSSRSGPVCVVVQPTLLATARK